MADLFTVKLEVQLYGTSYSDAVQTVQDRLHTFKGEVVQPTKDPKALTIEHIDAKLTGRR